MRVICPNISELNQKMGVIAGQSQDEWKNYAGQKSARNSRASSRVQRIRIGFWLVARR
jgi:hypothetical protein